MDGYVRIGYGGPERELMEGLARLEEVLKDYEQD